MALLDDGMNGAESGGFDERTDSKVGRIHEAMFKAILARELVPGTKLSEDSIGSLFSVSRTIVRAALNRLHTESLVEFKKNRGAFVASVTPEEARQVFDARTVVEREIFSKLARVVTDRQIVDLSAHLKREHEIRRTGDHTAAILLSGDFHLLAAAMAGNEVLAVFLKSLISRTSLILAQHSTGNHDSDCNLDDHGAIIGALKARDPEASGRAIVHHLWHVFAQANIDQNERPRRSLGDILSRYA